MCNLQLKKDEKKKLCMANRKARRAQRFGREMPAPKHSKLEGVGELARNLRHETIKLEDGEVAGPASVVSSAPPPIESEVAAQAPVATPSTASSGQSLLPPALAQVLASFAPDFAALVSALHVAASRNAPAPSRLLRPLSAAEMTFLRGLRAYLTSRRLPTAFLDDHMPT